MLEGRGLFYGADANGHIRVFTPQQWDAQCRQAREWGIDIVHPKVADGPYAWYDGHGMLMLRETARKYGLRIAPYHYWWGNLYPYGNNPNRLVEEVQLGVNIANFFGAVCPDIEKEWDNKRQWAIQAGSIIKQQAHPGAEFYPTLYANPQSHPTPYPEIEQWATAWMPMVYFSLWIEAGHQMTAVEAIQFVHPQWQALDQHILSLHQTPKLKLPILELGDHLPPQEVASWLDHMADFGYCGFWYDGTYAPYAQTIAHAPRPAHPKAVPVPVPPVAAPAPAPLSSAPAPAPAPAAPESKPTTTAVEVSQNDPTPPAAQAPVVSSEPSPAEAAPAPEEPTETALEEALPSPSLGFKVAQTAQGIVIQQPLSEDQLKVLWHRRSSSVPWDPTHPWCEHWLWLVQHRPMDNIGTPLSDVIGTTIDGQDVTILPLSSGRDIVYYKASQTTVLI